MHRKGPEHTQHTAGALEVEWLSVLDANRSSHLTHGENLAGPNPSLGLRLLISAGRGSPLRSLTAAASPDSRPI